MHALGKRKRPTPSATDASKKQKMPDDARQGRIVFDRDGDVLLAVQPFQRNGSSLAQFQVSSKALSLGSPVFKAMFSGKFMENANSAAGLRAASLQDDDPEALMLLCNIAHLRFNMVPKKLSLDALFNLAVISDKYDTVGMVKPFITQHCDFYRNIMTEAGNEVYFYITWALGLVDDFKRMFMHLVFEIRIPSLISGISTTSSGDSSSMEDMMSDDPDNTVELILKMRDEEREGRLNELLIVNCEDEEFSADLPPHSKVALLLIREDIFQAIQALCSVYWHGLQKRMMSFASPDHGQYECFAMEFGHLSHILSKWNIHPDASHARRSISLRSLTVQLLDYKPLRCIGCKVPGGCCRSDADYKSFRNGLQELEIFRTNGRSEVVSLLQQVKSRDHL
ncbi:uncharacterized protein PV09_05535 [Verruconis gallopava]|uniref:BTB domain-containing protein n=1 Tax=Verruconis gallopava TaxID=253628 RepID=A0A0D2AVY0_9PEZI|nr:uncharacterized protein PV09_05535 [Verruconis gallopava]KIW03324.1 hypothetical protein PV09_05535 [Verruconis gallopava]